MSTKLIVKEIGREHLPDTAFPDGVGLVGESIQVFIVDEEVQRLLSLYDPGSSSSPPASDCRPIARAILDILKEIAR